jgi:hypothetical protein
LARWQNFNNKLQLQKRWVAAMTAKGYINYSPATGLVHVEGYCRECGDWTSSSTPTGRVLAGAYQQPQAPNAPRRRVAPSVTVRCACNGQHAGRPPKLEGGCGASGPVDPLAVRR